MKYAVAGLASIGICFGLFHCDWVLLGVSFLILMTALDAISGP